jgi:DNA-binding NarL/FixJ family response regulator
LKVLTEAEDSEMALTLIQQQIDGIEVARALRQKGLSAGIVILTMHKKTSSMMRWMMAREVSNCAARAHCSNSRSNINRNSDPAGDLL